MNLEPPPQIDNFEWKWRAWFANIYQWLMFLDPNNATSGHVLTADGSGSATYQAASAGGVWAELDDTTVSGSPANYEFTWDESLYSDIRIVYTGIQPASDTVSLYLIVGHTDGGTMFNSASDYDGNERERVSTTWSALSDTDQVRIAPNYSNASNETASGTIEITGSGDPNTGCNIDSKTHYLDAASNQRSYKVEAFLDDGNVGAIDTARLFFASGNLANVGTIKLYGLTK